MGSVFGFQYDAHHEQRTDTCGDDTNREFLGRQQGTADEIAADQQGRPDQQRGQKRLAMQGAGPVTNEMRHHQADKADDPRCRHKAGRCQRADKKGPLPEFFGGDAQTVRGQIAG